MQIDRALSTGQMTGQLDGEKKPEPLRGRWMGIVCALIWIFLVFGVYFYRNLERIMPKMLTLLGLGG